MCTSRGRYRRDQRNRSREDERKKGRTGGCEDEDGWRRSTDDWLAVRQQKDGFRGTRATSTASRYRYFFALARTRPSNTPLRIVVCAVWKGFNIACGPRQRRTVSHHHHTFKYSSHTSCRNPRIPSSFLLSCSSINLVSARNTVSPSRHPSVPDSLPGVMNADTVHSLNLSTDLRYLSQPSVLRATITSPILHRTLPPHHIFNHVQTCVRDHLDHMAVLSPAHPRTAPLHMV